jgi:protein ImuA
VSLSHVLVVHAEEPLWACEQALRSGACEVALTWIQRVQPRALRRLQLATERGRTLAFLFRTLCERTVREPSGAVLRIAVQPASEGVHVELLKSRGGSREAVDLSFRPAADG